MKHQLTCAERDAGWLAGPFDIDQLEDSALVSRRFGLKQGEKTRLIDDLTVGGVNSTVQVAESPLPHTTDLLASLSLAILKEMPGMKILGKTFDLKSAYRQLAVSERSLWSSYVAHWNPATKLPEVNRNACIAFWRPTVCLCFPESFLFPLVGSLRATGSDVDELLR